MEDLLSDGRLLKKVGIAGKRGERLKKGDRAKVHYETRIFTTSQAAEGLRNVLEKSTDSDVPDFSFDFEPKTPSSPLSSSCSNWTALIDSSGPELFEFTLGLDEVLEAWDLGVASMEFGERSLFIAHHSLAYGEEGAGDIPSCATLLFIIHLFPIEFPLSAKFKGRPCTEDPTKMTCCLLNSVPSFLVKMVPLVFLCSYLVFLS